MFGRLLHSADFQRLLASPLRSRSGHFALHHLNGGPEHRRWTDRKLISTKLSTGEAQACPEPVDDSPKGHWLGLVIPKRHARRAVTRNLLRRQIRSAMDGHADQLPPGLWLVRLRAPFSREQFPSAASDALRQQAQHELHHLLTRAVQPNRGHGAPPLSLTPAQDGRR